MAGKGRQSWEKRQREKARRERQEAKRADRAERRDSDEQAAAPNEAELFERFAKLSEAHAEGHIDDETFETKKAELFEQLGLETH